MNKHKIAYLLPFILFSLLMQGCFVSDEKEAAEDYSACLFGVITGAAPVSGALSPSRVSEFDSNIAVLYNTKYSYTTLVDSNGAFFFKSVEPGNYAVIIKASGRDVIFPATVDRFGVACAHAAVSATPVGECVLDLSFTHAATTGTVASTFSWTLPNPPCLEDFIDEESSLASDSGLVVNDAYKFTGTAGTTASSSASKSVLLSAISKLLAADVRTACSSSLTSAVTGLDNAGLDQYAAPQVAISSLYHDTETPGTFLSGDSVTMDFIALPTASDQAISYVIVTVTDKITGRMISTRYSKSLLPVIYETAGQYRLEYSQGFVTGRYSLSLTAVDTAGNTATAQSGFDVSPEQDSDASLYLTVNPGNLELTASLTVADLTERPAAPAITTITDSMGSTSIEKGDTLRLVITFAGSAREIFFQQALSESNVDVFTVNAVLKYAVNGYFDHQSCSTTFSYSTAAFPSTWQPLLVHNSDSSLSQFPAASVPGESLGLNLLPVAIADCPVRILLQKSGSAEPVEIASEAAHDWSKIQSYQLTSAMTGASVGDSFVLAVRAGLASGGVFTYTGEITVQAPAFSVSQAVLTGQGFEVSFSGAVNPDQLESSCFSVDSGVTVTGVSLIDEDTVLVTTSALLSGAEYTLTVRDVRDAYNSTVVGYYKTFLAE
ncbi:MAG: hypothetical protein PHQ23_06165 [Candidatus Wallbacteria bacterium]|nr:hypothetical protein [Candidatus Wallbacteria bacterium]